LKNNDMFDWNDARFFLAVARSGSTLTASRELKISQPTVARRVAALEQALGLNLFERRQAGYRLTEEGEALVPQAEAMEAAAQALADGAQARARSLSGSVRLTCNEVTATYHLAPILAEFRPTCSGVGLWSCQRSM
jgi:molybdate transport repressor ModE-like protein